MRRRAPIALLAWAGLLLARCDDEEPPTERDGGPGARDAAAIDSRPGTDGAAAGGTGGGDAMGGGGGTGGTGGAGGQPADARAPDGASDGPIDRPAEGPVPDARPPETPAADAAPDAASSPPPDAPPAPAPDAPAQPDAAPDRTPPGPDAPPDLAPPEPDAAPDTGGESPEAFLDACFAGLRASRGSFQLATKVSSDESVQMRIALETGTRFGTSGSFAWLPIRFALHTPIDRICITDEAVLAGAYLSPVRHNCSDVLTVTAGGRRYQIQSPDTRISSPTRTVSTLLVFLDATVVQGPTPLQTRNCTTTFPGGTCVSGGPCD